MHFSKQDPAFTVEELEEAMQKVIPVCRRNRNPLPVQRKQLAMAEEKKKKLQILAKDLRQPICMS